ncbi:MATH/TRAF domain [Arabidopsis suecica]|uniref:MATH/TRAF domain n=1 Tax=Arabidopsis suecica TaxID=45249 RepID=A0A8T2A164_ARASU|nr:MATH/TRAF domain [Arabidopsis suecica]
MQEKFTWVLENFSSLQDECYSPVFTVAGCNWRLLACPRGVRKNDHYFSVYLDLAPESLPPGWRREVKFSITLANVWPIANRVLGEPCFFDAKTSNWGFEDFLLLEKLRNKGEGFLVNDRLTIVAEVHVLPAIVEPLEFVKIIASLSSNERNQADKSQGDSPCHQVAQTTDDAASQEKLDDNDDDDDDASEESTDDDDDDGSEESSDDEDASQEDTDDNDDGVCDISLLNQLMNSLEDASYTEENHGISCNNVVAETEVSNGESDDAPKKDDDDDEASSLVLNDNDGNGSTKEQVKVTRLHLVLEDASQTFKNGGRGLNTVASVMGTCDNVLMEIQQVQETVDINGFEVVSSKVESVRRIFERHPDIAVEFRGKNQHLKNACMNFLLSLIETMCQSLEELSNEDLVEADIALTYLRDAGFKVDWLEKKLDQLKEKKEEEMSGLARLHEIEENLVILKQKWSDLDALAEKEKAELSATRAAMSFDDFVY